jgi:hypothetical protein
MKVPKRDLTFQCNVIHFWLSNVVVKRRPALFHFTTRKSQKLTHAFSITCSFLPKVLSEKSKLTIVE